MRGAVWCHGSMRRARIAQSVEHQTFNLRVQGSSPCSGELETTFGPVH